MRALCAGVIGLVFLTTVTVSAGNRSDDSVTRLVIQLTHSSRFKLRLSAAVNLGKTRDPRAIVALSYAAQKDQSSTIRRIAIAGLTKLANQRSMPQASVDEALRTIDRIAKNDHNRKVRRAARAAQKKKKRRQSQFSKATRSDTRLFVAIGKPTDPQKNVSTATTKLMNRAVWKTIRRRVPRYDIGTLIQSENRRRAYFVGATIAAVSAAKRGQQTEVSCQINVRVSPLKGGLEQFVAGETASAKGSGRVIGASSKSAVAESKKQCVLAVVEQVTESQVVPFILQISAAQSH